MKGKRLTDAQIEAAVPREKPYVLNDGAGLKVCIYPTGKKSFRVLLTSRRKRWAKTLGEYPLITLKEARAGLVKARKERARRAVFDAAPTFEKAAYAWLDVWMRGSKPPTEETVKKVLARFKRHVFPRFGHKSLSDIEKADIKALLFELEKEGLHATARFCFTYTNLVYKFACQRDLCGGNPCAGVIVDGSDGILQRYEPIERPALISEEGILELIEKINGIEARKQRYALVLMFLLATRTKELLGAKWEEIDLRRARWDIPKGRMKNRKKAHIVPLSKQAIACLEGLKAEVEAGGYLFFIPSEQDKNLIYNELVRLGFKGRHCGHGFRATYGTKAHTLNLASLGEIDKQLSHAEPGRTQRAYIREDAIEDRASLMQAWADYLQGLGLQIPTGRGEDAT